MSLEPAGFAGEINRTPWRSKRQASHLLAPARPSPVQSPVFLYCSVHDRDTMHSRHRSNLLPRYQLSIRSIDENYAPNYPACIRYDHVFPASIQRTNEHPSRYLSAVYHPIYPRKSQFNYTIDRFLPKVWSKLFGNGDGRILGESAPLPPRSVFQCRV